MFWLHVGIHDLDSIHCWQADDIDLQAKTRNLQLILVHDMAGACCVSCLGSVSVAVLAR